MSDVETWRQRVVPRGTVWVLAALAALLVAVVAAQQWILVAIPLILAPMLLRSVVDVRIDDAGLTVRGVVRRPSLHVPATDVVRAGVRQHVSPVQEFGGHGWRTSPGGTRGVVLREGAALLVERHDAGPVVITVDDAEGAATALTAAARAARSR